MSRSRHYDDRPRPQSTCLRALLAVFMASLVTVWGLASASVATAQHAPPPGTGGIYLGEEASEPSTAQSAPDDITARPGDAQISVTWTNQHGAQSHSIRYRSMRANSDWQTAHTVTSPYLITGLENLIGHEVQVAAVYTSATLWSGSVSVRPFSPVKTVIVTTGSDRLHVDWEDIPSIISDKVRYRLAAESTWSAVAVGPTQGTALWINNLKNGHTYEVQVGNTVAGRTQWSATVSAIPFSAPSGVAVKNGDASLELTWVDGVGAKEHKIRYRERTTSQWTNISNPHKPLHDREPRKPS